MTSLAKFHSPKSVAIIGASNDPEKIGGRPIKYMREFGFEGDIYPVNPSRSEIQGVQAFKSVDDLPIVPDVAIIAVAGKNAVDAVVRCAELGVSGCIVMASGFGETGLAEDIAMQNIMLEAAAKSGMRIIGPNSQGLANFANGAVLSFSTLFTEQQPEDGPVAIVSQSGAMASVAYGLLRQVGIGVRYAHGTGNDIDVSVGELAIEVARDPQVKLLLLYLEVLQDPDSIAELARVAREQGVAIIALKGGRSEAGQRAAASHTGALANEDRVVDAFLEKHGIWRARSTQELVLAAELYLKPSKPKGQNIAVVSNSGAVCVLVADAIADYGLQLANFSDHTRAALESALPSFAAADNPIDVTAALLTDSSLFGKVLPIIGADSATHACIIGIPVAGKGYDVERFAHDVHAFEKQFNMPVVLVIPQDSVAQVFRERDLVVFADELSAVQALSSYLRHHELIAHGAKARHVTGGSRRQTEATEVLNEYQSLQILDDMGIPVVAHVLVTNVDDVELGFAELGAERVVIKGCTSDATHKSELGLVRVGVSGPVEAREVVQEMFEIMRRENLRNEGAIISQLVSGIHEGMLGSRNDPVFGPVVVLGAGGIFVEAMPDAQVLLPPFSVDDALRAISRLRISAVLDGSRGKPAIDRIGWAQVAVTLGESLLNGSVSIASLDVNPLMLLEKKPGELLGVCAVDAVVILQENLA